MSKDSPIAVRRPSPQPLATADLLTIETDDGVETIRGIFAREDALELEAAGVVVLWSERAK